MHILLPNFLPAELLREIEAMHSAGDRGYHGWDHPLALLRLHCEVSDQLHDTDVVAAAILLHDAIFDPRRSDNEARSGDLAVKLLTPYMAPGGVERVRRLIEATATHTVPTGADEGEAEDARLFLDLDLSILGAAEAEFDAYEAGVRHEYRHVPEAEFAARRAEILERFLTRPRLYFTEWARERFEDQARRNVRRSIARLRNQTLWNQAL